MEWAEALYDGHAHRRIGLVKSQGDILRLRADLQIYYSGTVIPLLADSRPDDFEIEAIRLALRGRESAWVAEIALRLPPEAAADENSAQGAAAGRSEDPIPATRRAQVDEYIAEVARVKKKRISRSLFWKAAGFLHATEFERWQRNDPRCSKQHARAFTRVLTEKPHLK